jgi:hypothetical protein
MRPRQEIIMMRVWPVTGFARNITARGRSKERDALSLLFEVQGVASTLDNTNQFVIDTDIPRGVPPVIRQCSQDICDWIAGKYPVDDLMTD